MVLKDILLQYEYTNNKSHIEMADAIGVSLSTYYRWLNGESVRLKKTTIRKLSAVLDYDVEGIIEESICLKPILGTTKAGYNHLAEENIDGYIEVGMADAKVGDYFLRVEGDSMEGCHIYDGDLVYVEQCDTCRSGEIAVVLIGNETTVKRVYYKNNLMILEAANPLYESRFFTAEEVEELPVKVVGRVRFVRRDFI